MEILDCVQTERSSIAVSHVAPTHFSVGDSSYYAHVRMIWQLTMRCFLLGSMTRAARTSRRRDLATAAHICLGGISRRAALQRSRFGRGAVRLAVHFVSPTRTQNEPVYPR